jgi:two-component system cell cycle response regulator DivK
LASPRSRIGARSGAARGGEPSGTAGLILIVEDNPANLLLTRSVLKREGYSVEGAESAAEARAILARRRPSLILMDIHLPGIDGIEFTRELKANPATSEIPIVILTAQAMPIFERAARSAGCAGYITKPSPAAVIAAAVKEHLRPVDAG